MLRKLLALSLLVLAPLARAVEVRVFAAASLTEALEDIARMYRAQTGDRIVFNFGGSSMLARQIEAGAPADVFLSADEAKVAELARWGLIAPSTRIAPLSNSLVVVVPDDSRLAIHGPKQLAALKSIALAEPSSVPAGIYARLYLQNAGIWNSVSRKLVPTANVRAALAAVASGNVDAAIVYRTDAAISRRVRIAYEVPRAQGPVISYSFAAVSNAEEPAAARRFLHFLTSKPALAVFARHGFVIR